MNISETREAVVVFLTAFVVMVSTWLIITDRLDMAAVLMGSVGGFIIRMIYEYNLKKREVLP